MTVNLVCIRDTFSPEFTLGTFLVNGKLLGQTCEDFDRRMETGGEKVYGKTAIPRGLYKVTLSFSHHFQRILPEVHDVPGFSGVRIHGGNTADDTLGCILVGGIRTARGCANCASIIAKLIAILEEAENNGEEVTLEVK